MLTCSHKNMHSMLTCLLADSGDVVFREEVIKRLSDKRLNAAVLACLNEPQARFVVGRQKGRDRDFIFAAWCLVAPCPRGRLGSLGRLRGRCWLAVAIKRLLQVG